jgi:hypothetical protein
MATTEPDALDAYLDAAAAVLGIAIEPEWRPGVRFHLATTLALADLVVAFPLDDEAEPAPVFEA